LPYYEIMFIVEVFHLIGTFTSSPRDYSAMCCVCKDWYSFSLDESTEALFVPDSVIGEKIRLSNEQTAALDHLRSLLRKRNPNCYMSLPMSTGKTLISLLYCISRVKETGKNAIIYLPDKAMSTYQDEIRKFNLGKYMSSRLLPQGCDSKVIISRRPKPIEFKLKIPICCVFVDEAHTGYQSAQNIKYMVGNYNNCNRGKSEFSPIQLVFMTAANNPCSDDFNYYAPKIDISPLLADVNYYPCLTTKGGHYSVRVSKETKQSLPPPLPLPEDDKIGTIIVQRLNRSNAVLAELLQTVKRVVIMYNQEYECPSELLDHLGIKYKVCKNRSNLRDTESNVLLLSVAGFSESVNINNYSNLILFNYNGSEERARQCVGRLQRITNTAREINVWIISGCPTLAFSIIPPKDMIAEYKVVLGKTKDSLFGLRDVPAQMFVPEMTLKETIVICRKSVSPKRSLEWLESERTHYSIQRISQFLKSKDYPEIEKGCYLSQLHPIKVSYRSKEVVEGDRGDEKSEINRKKLEFTRDNPRSRDGYTVEELKMFCATCGVNRSGTKAEMVTRLMPQISK